MLPDRLATALRRAHDAERAASGPERVPAFRLTRALLGGARRAGYAPARLAQCLGVSVSSVQSRSTSDGWITADTFAELTGLDIATVTGWASAGLLPNRATDEDDRDCWLASELIHALDQPVGGP